jgi:tetratricopeptide (TPR) repeat protein
MRRLLATTIALGLGFAVWGTECRAAPDDRPAVGVEVNGGPLENAEAYYKRGLARSENGDLDGAIADFTEAIRLDPKDARGFYNRGLARESLNDLRGAVRDYSQAIVIGGLGGAPHHGRAMVWRSEGRSEAALAEVNIAIGLEPKNASYLYDRGLIWVDLGDSDKAIGDLKSSAELGRDPFPAYMQLAGIYKSLNRTYDTLAYLKKAHESSRNNAQCIAEIVLHYYRSRSYDDAIEFCNRWVVAEPKNPHAFTRRGMLWEKKREYTRAIADYTQALSIYAAFAPALEGRERVYRLTKDVAKADADAKALESLKAR